jgi:hypothetical protein
MQTLQQANNNTLRLPSPVPRLCRRMHQSVRSVDGESLPGEIDCPEYVVRLVGFLGRQASRRKVPLRCATATIKRRTLFASRCRPSHAMADLSKPSQRSAICGSELPIVSTSRICIWQVLIPVHFRRHAALGTVNGLHELTVNFLPGSSLETIMNCRVRHWSLLLHLRSSYPKLINCHRSGSCGRISIT